MPGPPQYIPKEKVYCCECKYLWGKVECMHPKNRRYSKESWLSPGESIPHKHPSKINKKNNCVWYEKFLKGGKVVPF